MLGKINSHICLMLSAYESFHQTVKYGRQRILKDLTGLETLISMKASKTKNRYPTGFQQPKSGLQKNGINIPSPNISWTLVILSMLSKDNL